MLPINNRLKNKRAIDVVFKHGKTQRSDFLFLRFRPNGKDQTRIAFSIGQKYSKKATDRNYAKRLLRECSKEFLPLMAQGYDLVFYFQKVSPDQMNINLIKSHMKTVLKKSNLFLKNSNQ